MAITNHQRIEGALGIFVQGLAPFVERELQAALGKSWKDQIEGGFSGSKNVQWDTSSLIGTMLGQWNAVFSKTLGNGERSLAHEIKDFRNKWAHQQKLTYDDVYRTLDSISRLLAAVSAGDQVMEIEKQKQEILRVKYDEQRRSEERKVSVAPVEGKPAANLKPWREVIQPHPDVASGRYQQAEFAADLWQVYMREGSDEYKDPAEFFRRTFLTEGLKHLLAGAVERLCGKGGDPVVELQTNFGGGKTHSMLALFHLFSGESSSRLAGVDDLLKASGVKVPSSVSRAVLVGTKISPGQVHKKPDGTKVRTLWGEIAWQLGNQQGYEMVREADETSTNPGDGLRELFNKFSPCLVLIDEWVAYARQLHEDVTLPAGTFDTQFTFAQTLTEAAKAADRTLLVVSIPASESSSPQEREKILEIEVGGQRGRESLVRLKNAIGRVEASWRPASQDEGFEIVRRRLFQPMTDKESFVARDQTAKAFRDLYEQQKQEFPSECKEASYGRRIESAYPIHPELFDRLYNDWSTLDKFQRTRGVLRLMASVIHWLWEHQDHNLMIMPATVPIDDSRVQFELTRYLEDQWIPVIDKDVDGPHSLPLALDRELPNLGRYSACRRVARTIYMGSAPVQRAANRGIDERQVKLGCVQPGESVATFGDAIRRLTDRATYLYEDGKRYWYSTQPTVTRLAEDRASQMKEDAITQEIEARLKEQTKTPGEFARVHSGVTSSDIPDEREVRLVILGPEHPHTQKDPASAALQEAKRILESRGNSPRTYKNTLIFLAPDQNRLRDLNQAVRLYLAWKSIHGERESLDLTPFQLKQAEQRLKSAADTVAARLPEAYQWLLVPEQSDPKGPVEIKEQKISGGDSFAAVAAKKLKNDGSLITSWSGINLRHELDRIPLWRDNDVKVKQLADDFATYIYLPRLKDTVVLIQAIEDGISRLSWELETFAFAEDFDEKKNRYVGLHARENFRVNSDSRCMVVKPDVAAAQIAAEQPAGVAPMVSATPSAPGAVDGSATTVTAPPQKTIRRFYGSVKLDPTRTGRDAGRVAEEVLQHLSAIEGAEVQVTLEISADLPEGAPEKTVRDVTENCRTLKFTNYDFEEE